MLQYPIQSENQLSYFMSQFLIVKFAVLVIRIWSPDQVMVIVDSVKMVTFGNKIVLKNVHLNVNSTITSFHNKMKI